MVQLSDAFLNGTINTVTNYSASNTNTLLGDKNQTKKWQNSPHLIRLVNPENFGNFRPVRRCELTALKFDGH